MISAWWWMLGFEKQTDRALINLFALNFDRLIGGAPKPD
jgi:hypothetical protein